MADRNPSPDIARMSFEDALNELQMLVKSLEKGESKLDEAVQSYERGVALKRHCEAKLTEAQAKVDKIVLGADGAVSTEPARLD
ncbi:exodeoxyribonuclease VII small subunit [Rhodospirillaceae bacterium SYSU D60014]|jgi:exodeoxyribonuclease VII small subunit|uniref:exodeoxyribonuclease VII small subunit n=1 Tax=Virgifigura deserti TaxID=2268457 RepID=UPI000E665FD9